MLEERPERMERSDRKRMGRNERGDHSDRFERPERPERQERLERPDRIDRMDRGEETQPSRKRGDEWHDPWIRSVVPCLEEYEFCTKISVTVKFLVLLGKHERLALKRQRYYRCLCMVYIKFEHRVH